MRFNTSTVLKSSFYWLLGAGVIVGVYMGLVVFYADNIPFLDDLSLAASLYEFHQADTWLLKAKILLAFHNEHRLLMPRLLTLLLYEVQLRHIHFGIWVVVGNLMLLVLLVLLYTSIYKQYLFRFFIPVLLLVLQPMHYELMYWGMASIQNIGVLLLACLCINRLVFTNRLWLPIALAILAVFTSANGVFIFLIGILYSAYQKQWYRLLIWLLIGSFFAWLYWHGFSIKENAGQGFNRSFQLWHTVNTFFSLIMGVFYTKKLRILSTVLGFIWLLLFIYILYIRLFSFATNPNKSQKIPTDLFIVSCLTLILLTMCAISLGRNSDAIVLVSRYRLYAALLLAFTYSLFVAKISEQNQLGRFAVTLIFSLLFSGFSYGRYLPLFPQHHQLLKAYFFNWKYSNLLDIENKFAAQYYSDIWQKICQRREYIPDQNTLAFCEEIIKKIHESPHSEISYTTDSTHIYINPFDHPANTYYAIRIASGRTAIYPLGANRYYGLTPCQTHVAYSATINRRYWLAEEPSNTYLVSLGCDY